MSEDIIVKAMKREQQGSGAARRLRKDGRIPSVLYGATEPQVISVDAHDFGLQIQHHGHSFVADLVVDGASPIKVLPRDIQHDPLSGDIIHVDFVAISMTEVIQISIPLDISGEAAGVAAGGIMEHQLTELDVECLPGKIVESIALDVTNMELGDHLNAGDVALPEGYVLLTDPETTIISVSLPRVEQEPAEGEGEEGAEGGEGAEEEGGAEKSSEE